MHFSKSKRSALTLRTDLPWHIRFAVAAIAIAVALALTRLIPAIQSGTPFLFFFLAIAVSAFVGGLRIGLLASVVSLVVVAYWVMLPADILSGGGGRLFQFAGFLVVSAIITWLVHTLDSACQIIDEQRESLHSTLASIGDAVISTDTKGNVAWMNGVAADLTGWTLEEVTGKPLNQIFRIVNEHTRGPVENPVDRVLTDGRVVGLANHTLLIHKDGTERPIDDSAAPIRDINGALIGVVLVFRDISHRKQLEQSLVESRAAAEQAHQNLAAVLERVDDSFYAVDRDWRITYMNQRASERVNTSVEEAIGRNFWEVFPQLLGTVYEEQYRKVMAEQHLAHFEARGVLTDRWFEARVYPSAEGLSILGRDITERKQAEEALRASEERFAKVFHSGPLAITITRLADGRIIEVNQTFTTLMGYARAETLGRTPVELGLWVDPKQRSDGLVLLRAGHPVLNTEVRLRMKDGRERTCFISAEIVELNGETCVMTVINDITERKETEQALHQSEERFRVALKQAPITLAQIDRNLRYTWLHNPHPSISAEEMIGRTFGGRLPTDQREKMHALVRRVIENRTGVQAEYYGEFADGRRYYDAIVEPFANAAGEVVGVTLAALNVTPHKQMAEALRAAAEELQTLMDILPVGVFVAHDPEARRITGNPTAYQMFRQPTGTNLSKTAPEEQRPAHYRVFRNGKELRDEELPFSYAVAHGVEVRDTESELHFADGEIAYIYGHAKPLFDAQGKVRGCVGIYLDITHIKRYERSLAHHAFILENVRDAVIALDMDGQITLWNRGAEELYGWQAHEVLGRPGAEIVGTSSTPDGRRSVEGMIQKQGRYSFEVTHHSRTGDALEVEIVMAALQRVGDFRERDGALDLNGGQDARSGDDERFTGYVGIIRNIAERKRLERELRQLNETLEQRVRERTDELEQINRELDQFAYIASHDLKAPLRAISLLGEWIRDDAGSVLPPASQVHLEKMQGRIQRMDKLLSDLLAYSRAGRLRYPPERIDTAALIESIAELLHLPSGFTVTVVRPMPVVVVEAVPLETVLRNLISNAIKHHHRPDSGRVTVSAHEAAGRLEFTVRDNGPGIAPQFHERIFGVFQTLRPRDEVEGSGMGLAIVKRIVESRGGIVKLESQEGQGASFSFTWPVAEA